MVLKRLTKGLKKLVKKKEEEYPNRFLKFYYKNKRRLNKERRSLYTEKQKHGICVRCRQPAVEGKVFCSYHRAKQKEYNKKARSK